MTAGRFHCATNGGSSGGIILRLNQLADQIIAGHIARLGADKWTLFGCSLIQHSGGILIPPARRNAGPDTAFARPHRGALGFPKYVSQPPLEANCDLIIRGFLGSPVAANLPILAGFLHPIALPSPPPSPLCHPSATAPARTPDSLCIMLNHHAKSGLDVHSFERPAASRRINTITSELHENAPSSAFLTRCRRFHPGD